MIHSPDLAAIAFDLRCLRFRIQSFVLVQIFLPFVWQGLIRICRGFRLRAKLAYSGVWALGRATFRFCRCRWVWNHGWWRERLWALPRGRPGGSGTTLHTQEWVR